MSTALEHRPVDAVMERLAARWPQGNLRPRTEMPGWAEQWLNFAFALPRRELNPVDAFMQVPIVNAGIRKLQEDVASIPLRVWKGRGKIRTELERTGKEVDVGGNLADLLTYANPWETGRQLTAAAIAHRVLSGDAYWFMSKYRGPKRPPNYLWTLPGHLVRPVPGEAKPGDPRPMRGYEWNGNWSGPMEPLNADNLIHFRAFNPKDEPVGLSDLQAVQQSCQIQYYALLWLKQFFLKGGVIPGIWSLKDEERLRLSDDGKQALKEKLQREFVGWSNIGQAVVVQGLEYLAAGMTLKDMELDRQLAIAEANLLRALGIPPWEMGIKEGSNLGSPGAGQDSANYWLGRITQLCSGHADVINERIAPLFGPDVSVEFDLSGILSIQNARLEQAKTHQALTGGEAIETVNEARDSIGREERPEPEYDELYKRPIAGLMPDGTPIPMAASDEKPPPKKASQRLMLAAVPDDPHAALRLGAREGVARWQGRFEAFVLGRLAEQKAAVLERLSRAESVALGRANGKNGGAEKGRHVALDAVDVVNVLDEPDEDDLARAQRMLEVLLRERMIDATRDLEAAAGVALEVALDLSNERAAEFIRRQVDRAINVPDRTTARMLREHLAEVVGSGGGLSELRAAVDEVFEMRRTNALTIARTEVLPAYNFGAMEAWKQSGVVDKHYWLTSRSGLGGRHSEDPDGRYALSDGGRGLDGQTRALGDEFDCGGVPMLYPGDPGGPAGECINCFLPGTRVSGAFVAGVKSLYQGPAREIVLQSGARLSVTPNHPVLTAKGMVRAGELREGDHLLCDRVVVGGGSHAYQEQAPALIEDVFEALRVGRVTTRTNLRPSDLHGDARLVVGEVDVVTPDSPLGNEFQAPGAGSGGDLALVKEPVGLALLARDGAAHASLLRINPAATSSPGATGLLLDAGTVALDLAPLDPKLVAYRADLDAALAKLASERDTRDPRRLGDVLQRLAGTVAVDQVVEVRDFDWEGHVYDLQSTSGLMVASGLIVSNCVCSLVPILDEPQLRLRRVRKALRPAREKAGAHPEPGRNGQNRLRDFLQGVK